MQKPSSLTIDEACDILVAKESNYEVIDGTAAIDDLFFKRMFSVVKVALKGPASLNGEKVSKFSLTAPEGTVLTGRAAIDLTTATIDTWTIPNNSVTATYSEDAPIFGGAANLENEVWLVVNPGTIESGAKVVFAGETAKYTFSKEVTLSKALTFPESQLAVINLTLAEENCTAKQAESRIYVENFSNASVNKTQLQPNATGAIGTGVSDKLAYTYSSENVNIRFNNNGHNATNPYLYIPAGGIFTIENIVLNGETSLMLSAQVKTNSSTSDVKVYYKESSKDSWTVANTIFKATTSSFDTVQKILFNINSNIKSLDLKFEPTGAVLVDDLVLENFVNSRVKLEAPTSLSANVDEAKSNKVNLSWGSVNNANSYEIVLSAEGKADIIKTAETNSLSIEGLEYSTSYSVKVKAISPDAEKYFDSDYCTSVAVTTGAKPAGGSTRYFVKVTTAPTDWSGKYLIVFGNKARSYVATKGKDLMPKNTRDLSIIGNKIESNETVNVDMVEISKTTNGYKILLSDSKYLSVPASNACGSNTTGSVFTITLGTTGVSISGVDSKNATRTLCNNSTYYRMYTEVKESYTLPQLYKLAD